MKAQNPQTGKIELTGLKPFPKHSPQKGPCKYLRAQKQMVLLTPFTIRKKHMLPASRFKIQTGVRVVFKSLPTICN